MRMILLMSACLAFWPTLLAAREIRVKSGEHAGFSRLVLYTTHTEMVTLVKSESGYRANTGNSADSFATAGVFTMIPRDRIADLRPAGAGGLDIVLDCDCTVETLRLPGGQFVIDVRDSLANEQPEPGSSGMVPANGRAIPHPDQATAVARAGLPISTDRMVDLRDALPAKASHPTTSANVNQPVPPRQHLTEEDLLKQLSRAAAQGLVTVPSGLDGRTADAQATPDTDKSEPPTVQPHPAINNVTVQTAMDRDVQRATHPAGGNGSEHVCSPAAAYAIADWGDAAAGHLDFARHRSSLMTDIAKMDSTALAALLRHQLYLTLGTEVRATLRRYGDDLTDIDTLTLIAEVMDSGMSADFPRMSAQLGCDGPVVLWAILAHPRLPREAEINRAAAIAEFSALPRHLRVHLGPMLMRKFLAIGDTETAIEVNAITQRGAPPSDSDIQLSQAQLDLVSGHEQKAQVHLENIVEADDQNAVQAMLLLIGQKTKSDEGISDRTLELLASLAHEHKNSTSGPALAMAEIEAMIHMSRFTDAYTRLVQSKQRSNGTPDPRRALLDRFARALTSAASDGTFLRYTLGNPIWTGLDEAPRVDMATRLLGLGFPADAKNMLTQPASSPGRAARLLIAKASLEEGKPRVALGYLSGLAGADAEQTRRKALLDAGYEVATDLVGADATKDLLNASEPGPTLAARQTLLEGSRAFRERVENTLLTAPEQ